MVVSPSPEDVQTDVALQQRLAAATQVISVPPAGRASSRLGSAPTLPPEFEAQRRMALSGWKSVAQEFLDTCVARSSQARQPVAMEVAFAPLSRTEGDSQQVFIPEWIRVPPPELQRLWRDTNPEKLQECLDRARGLTMTVPLSGNMPTQDFPLLAESVLVQL